MGAKLKPHWVYVCVAQTLRGRMENNETKIFCSFLRTESEFGDRFLLSALEHRKKKMFTQFLAIFSYLC